VAQDSSLRDKNLRKAVSEDTSKKKLGRRRIIGNLPT